MTPAGGPAAGRVVVLLQRRLEPLAVRFLANRRAEIAPLREAAASADFDTLRRSAHDLKGLAGSLGFVELTKLGAALEGAAQRSDASEAKHLVESLADHLASLRVDYL